MEENTLYSQLAKVTEIVADSGDFKILSKYNATDATTNPTLLLKAVEKPEYQNLVQDAIKVSSLLNPTSSLRNKPLEKEHPRPT